LGVELSIEIGNLKLANPVLVASGTFGYDETYQKLLDLNKVGALVTKTLTLKPRPGNAPPRIVETPSGMLNSIGLQNEGIDDFLKNKIPGLCKLKIPIIVSIAGEGIEDYAELAQKLGKIKEVAALEINISCPNVEYGEEGECLFAQDIYMSYGVVKAVRESTDKTIIAKLSPNVTNIVTIAQAAYDAGTDALSLVNTFFGLAVDIEKRKPKLGTVVGGLSGPAIKPIALYMVQKVAGAVKLPVIGMGGIVSASDALEFIISGATAVAVGTANFINPKITSEIVEGIEEYLKEHKLNSIKELVGTLVA
jgi:dihydroorotate dehydrogenase (NAD+) catalytic subunit